MYRPANRRAGRMRSVEIRMGVVRKPFFMNVVLFCGLCKNYCINPYVLGPGDDAYCIIWVKIVKRLDQCIHIQ